MRERAIPAVEFDVGEPMRQCRLVPLTIPGGRAFLAVHSGCAEDDPYRRMFFLPTDTLKLTAFSATGERLWRRDLGGGMIPGVWFCPVLPFDLDGDGTDEVFVVSNADADHPLAHDGFVLDRMSAATGEVVDSIPWPAVDPRQPMSHLFRNFINAAFSAGRRRLITCQGTYGSMQIQCRDADMELLWERRIAADDPGARGSHMFPVIDIDGDDRDELLWGERCIDVDSGRDIWVADEDAWRGHSDVIQPTLDPVTGRWLVYTCREAPPPDGAVVMFDDRGSELWGRRGLGHMDMGWTARLGEAGEHLCYALQIGGKSAGSAGFKRRDVTEFLFTAAGEPLEAPFPLRYSLPVDFDGDGLSELTYTEGPRRGLVVDRTGREIARLAGAPLVAGKMLDAPGEQIATRDGGGVIRIYACDGAEDTPAARLRYDHPYYSACVRLWAMAYNRANLGGL